MHLEDKTIALVGVVFGASSMGIDWFAQRSLNVEACIGMLMAVAGLCIFVRAARDSA